ncbi:MAG: hypothetical protein M3Q20_04480 [Actinomycetota bacterium]|nr:hypothetical protein [Actinomycetota bacterium]
MITDAFGPGSLEPPVWYGPLREPSWLVPRVRDDAARVLFCAEPWQASAVGGAGRDLRLGLPLFLAEALRFGTDARAVVMRTPVPEPERFPGAAMIVRTAVAPEGEASIRVRVLDPIGVVVSETVREAHDEAMVAAVLEGLPRVCMDAVASSGIRQVWSSVSRPPSGVALVSYVRGQRACLRVSDEAVPATADATSVADRRNDVRSILTGLGSLATSTSETFPALLFFGALLAAHDVGSPVVGELRLQANARCTIATDPHDPIYAMSALVLRIFGDRDTSERRMDKLRALDDPMMHRWVARVAAIA